MHKIRFGLIKERKTPPDQRVVLSPGACQKVLSAFPKSEIRVESSEIRVFSDSEYRDAGLILEDSMESCDVLLGVKEVPVEALLPDKAYFFFSHTIKKQPYNRKLLRALLDKRIEFYDHEVLTDVQGNRLVAFGRYAGIVGAYNGFYTYGLKTGRFTLPRANTLKDQQALIAELRKLEFPAIKILITGCGRVGNGAREMVEGMGMRQVSANQYLTESFQEPVYCQIDVMDYNKRRDNGTSSKSDFFANPEAYESNFLRFARETDLYMAGHFFGARSPYIFTREDARHPEFKIKVVADISCDIDGPVACTLRASTIADPIYGYDPLTESETDFRDSGAIAVMAIDNLPAELPRDASEGFGSAFVSHIIPAFFNGDADGILERARMTTKQGKLTPRYAYLQDYADGKE